MKKHIIHEIIPDSQREELDFIGQVFCPMKERFSIAYGDFQDAYNESHATGIRGVAPKKGCDADKYSNISAVRRREKFPSLLSFGGYGEFFTGDFLEDTAKHAWFSAPPSPQNVNALFRDIPLRDPKGLFTVYGAMPYVFVINRKKLGPRPAPARVSDLTDAAYEGCIGVGYEPDDISEILLFEIYKEQGAAGIRALAHNIGLTARKQELAASATGNNDLCCIYIMSWFFAHAVPKREYLEIVWPSDGALFSPLCLMAKRENTVRQEALLDFLFGAELGRVMADIWFPHVSAAVDNHTPEGAGFRWVGWDFLYEKGFAPRVREIESVYCEERRKILRGLRNAI